MDMFETIIENLDGKGINTKFANPINMLRDLIVR
jgi:hypothetical protein